MSLTKEERSVRIGETAVTVLGQTDGAKARWRLQINGKDVADERILRGDRTLRGQLHDGSAIEASVHQGLFGPTRVEVRHGGEVVLSFRGFVL